MINCTYLLYIAVVFINQHILRFSFSWYSIDPHNVVKSSPNVKLKEIYFFESIKNQTETWQNLGKFANHPACLEHLL